MALPVQPPVLQRWLRWLDSLPDGLKLSPGAGSQHFLWSQVTSLTPRAHEVADMRDEPHRAPGDLGVLVVVRVVHSRLMLGAILSRPGALDEGLAGARNLRRELHHSHSPMFAGVSRWCQHAEDLHGDLGVLLPVLAQDINQPM